MPLNWISLPPYIIPSPLSRCHGPIPAIPSARAKPVASATNSSTLQGKHFPEKMDETWNLQWNLPWKAWFFYVFIIIYLFLIFWIGGEHTCNNKMLSVTECISDFRKESFYQPELTSLIYSRTAQMSEKYHLIYQGYLGKWKSSPSWMRIIDSLLIFFSGNLLLHQHLQRFV